jgi:hypothetical protein
VNFLKIWERPRPPLPGSGAIYWQSSSKDLSFWENMAYAVIFKNYLAHAAGGFYPTVLK